MDLKEAYNKIAPHWVESSFGEYGSEGLKKFISLLKKDDKVLDLGCGSGIRSKILVNNGISVFGVDFSEEMIKKAENDVPGARFQLMDINDVDALEESFDGIFAMAILLHLPKKEFYPMLEKLRNKLNDGGYLYIGLKEQKENESEEGIEKDDWGDVKTERFFSYYKMDEVKKDLEKLNMKVIFEELIKKKNRNWIIVIAQK